MADTTAKKQPTRGRGRPFKPGESANPSGRPTGARNRSTVAIEALLDGEADAIGRKVVELAKAGDTICLRLVMERIAPVRKSRPVRFTVPAIDTAADLVGAVGAVLRATAAGELTPDEAATVAGILEVKRRAIETVDLEGRLAALEQHAKEDGR